MTPPPPSRPTPGLAAVVIAAAVALPSLLVAPAASAAPTPRATGQSSVTPSVSIGNATVIEGDAAAEAVTATFAVSLSSVSALPVSVDFATADGTATQPGDYEARRGRLTFSPGETAKTVVVPIRSETIDELDEFFFVDLSNPANATIGVGRGVGKILNEDAPDLRPLLRLARSVGITRGYRARVGLACTAAATGRCRGTVSLSLGRARSAAARADGGRARATARRVGRRSFSIAAGRRATVPVRLSRDARHRLRRERRMR